MQQLSRGGESGHDGEEGERGIVVLMSWGTDIGVKRDAAIDLLSTEQVVVLAGRF